MSQLKKEGITVYLHMSGEFLLKLLKSNIEIKLTEMQIGLIFDVLCKSQKVLHFC
jgi:hypothetical protein